MPVASLVSHDVSHAQVIWRNGELIPWDEAVVHVRAAGHATVSAVFEGIKAYWNPEQQQLYVFRLSDHMQRLLDSMKIARLHCAFSADELVVGTLDLLRANKARQDTYIRPWAFIAGLVYEQIAPANVPTEVVIDTWPFHSAMLMERGCRACISSWTRIADNVLPPRVKAFSNYHNSRLGTIEATQNGYDWPLFLNANGKVTEGPGACVAMVRHGTVVTPSISSGLLDSITRATILHLLREKLDLPVVEREVERTELYIADELFFMGTGWEVLPIVDVDGLQVGDGKTGPVTRAIDRAYHDLVRGVDAAHEAWRSAVWQ